MAGWLESSRDLPVYGCPVKGLQAPETNLALAHGCWESELGSSCSCSREILSYFPCPNLCLLTLMMLGCSISLVFPGASGTSFHRSEDTHCRLILPFHSRPCPAHYKLAVPTHFLTTAHDASVFQAVHQPRLFHLNFLVRSSPGPIISLISLISPTPLLQALASPWTPATTPPCCACPSL